MGVVCSGVVFTTVFGDADTGACAGTTGGGGVKTLYTRFSFTTGHGFCGEQGKPRTAKERPLIYWLDRGLDVLGLGGLEF